MAEHFYRDGQWDALYWFIGGRPRCGMSFKQNKGLPMSCFAIGRSLSQRIASILIGLSLTVIELVFRDEITS